jgi:hypothetical protein
MASMVPTAHILKMFSNNQDLDDEEITAVETYVREVIARDTGSSDITGVNSAQLARAVQAINRTPNVPSTATNQFSNDFPNHINNMDSLNSVATKQRGTAAGFLDALADRHSDGSDGPFGNLPNNISSQWNDALIYTMGTQSGYSKLTSLLQYVMNHIRASVIGSGGFAVKGPPIVNLKHGAMYDFVPCIVKDYRFQPVDDAGYDTKSLFSQRLKVSLTLEEMRNVHGNQFGDPTVTGSLPGWESILSNGTLPNPIIEMNMSRHGRDNSETF